MKSILTAALILYVVIAHSQQDFLVSHTNFDKALYNPAAVGLEQDLNLSLFHRNQWTGMPGSPQTQVMHLKVPTPKINAGFGLLASLDQIGYMKRSDIYVSYSYQLKLSKTDDLSFGLRGGFSQIINENSKHTYWDQGDALLASNLNEIQPNFGFGVAVQGDKYYAGVSVPRLLDYRPQSVFSSTGEFESERHFHALFSYDLIFSDDWLLRPAVSSRYVRAAPLQADIIALFWWKKILGIGGGYRSNDAVIANIRVQILDRLRFGYAYDRPITALNNFTPGSHEFILGIGLGKSDKEHIPSFIEEIRKPKKK